VLLDHFIERTKPWSSARAISAMLFSMLLLGGCDAQPAGGQSLDAMARPASAPATTPRSGKADDEMIGLSLTGIDHLADHVSIQEFSVNGHSGAQAGKGGSDVCCVMVPRKWRPGLKATVRWGILNWRDWTGDEYQTVVDVEPYDEMDRFYVHFLPDGTVRAVVSGDGPRSPDYIGPRVPIPQKYPWKKYGPRDQPTKCIDHTVTPPAPCKD
jgi:Protein of unknown function (DUF3304)